MWSEPKRFDFEITSSQYNGPKQRANFLINESDRQEFWRRLEGFVNMALSSNYQVIVSEIHNDDGSLHGMTLHLGADPDLVQTLHFTLNQLAEIVSPLQPKQAQFH
jgi:hypothetical protein